MNIQIGKLSPPSEGSTAVRTSPPSGSNAAAAPAVPPPKAAAPQVQAASIETTKQVARQINDFLRSSASNVQFTVDDESSQVVVRIVDTQTKQLIRQIPSEEMLAISKSLDQLTGLLIKQKV